MQRHLLQEVLTMKKKWLVGLLVGTFLVTGCNDPDTPDVQALNDNHRISPEQVTYGLLGPGPINYGSIRHSAMKSQMAEVNTTGGSYRSANNYHQDLGDDQALMKRIVANESPFNPGSVMIAGHNAWVTVHVPQEFDQANKQTELDKLKRTFLLEVPRYEIHLKES
jgi:hypothetical protein